MEKILILGAGIFQVNLIKRAKEFGYWIIVATYKGNYPGLEFCDEVVDIDITDYDKLSALVEKKDIKAIMTTGSDVALPTIGKLVDKYQLIGPTFFAADIVSSKTNFRKFQKDNQIESPDFIKCKDVKLYLEYIQNSSGRFVVKPDDASGSRGIHFISANDSIETLESTFISAKSYSRNGWVCIEEFILGQEVGGDAFMVNGKVEFIVTTTKHLKGALVLGHTIPGSLNPTVIDQIRVHLEAICNTLGYRSGPLNFDVMVNEGILTVIEMGLRNGGNGIVDLIKKSYGIDLNEKLIQWTMGLEVEFSPNKNPTTYSSAVFGSHRKGLISKIANRNVLKSKYSFIEHINYAKREGEEANIMTNNSDLIGYMILKSDADNYYKNVAAIKNDDLFMLI
ncbi:ATP-grasp domain-containing protein [Gelidibacter gilvus]|uniref:ATP-grasp domain-containing protein n=1 Tax=Gelidibacter gilvus TaxID=59602 RepID=A0A4Q0XE68_9FLAO|nr:ATP-grasp domain-containing protein [Gelidibacter gilvus]RXJ46047.1 ATP-grasp domain-containing protein [Gelidibacter gilvus]